MRYMCKKILYYGHLIFNMLIAPLYLVIAIYKYLKYHRQDNVLILANILPNAGGAIALYYYVKALIDLKEKPLILFYENAELKGRFEELGVSCIKIPNEFFMMVFVLFVYKQFKYAIGNTVVMHPFVWLCQYINFPFALWIHEAATIYDTQMWRTAPSLRHAKKVYSVSEFAKSFITPYNSNVKILPPVIEDEYDRIPHNSQIHTPIRFINIGQISQIKGHDLLMDAYEQLTAEEKASCELYIVGKIGNSQYSNTIIQRTNKYQNIHLTGALPREKTLELLADSDILLFPSRTDSFSLVAVEAMMFDKPVLVSTMTGISSMITPGENGFVFESENVEQLVNYIRQFLANPRPFLPGKVRSLFLDNFSFKSFERNVKMMIQDLKN